jgi:hypothetical protein
MIEQFVPSVYNAVFNSAFSGSVIFSFSAVYDSGLNRDFLSYTLFAFVISLCYDIQQQST